MLPSPEPATPRRPIWPLKNPQRIAVNFLMPTRIAIVGVGLIRGSIGLALRSRGLAEEVIGVGRRPASLDKAKERGAVDWTTTNLVSGVETADFVVIATPVNSIVDTVRAVAAAAPRATITDAGSTKAEICRQLREPSPFDPQSEVAAATASL